MNRVRWLQVLAWVGTIGLLTWLFVQAQGLDQGAHQNILKLLGDINRSEGDVQEDLLRLRFQQAQNYDGLNADLDHLRGLSTNLRTALVKIDTTPEVLVALAEMRGRLDEKARLTEHFKARMAILKNGLAYLPMQVRKFQETHGGRASLDAEAVLRDMMLFNVSPTPANRRQLLQAGDALSAAARASGGAAHQDIDILATRFVDILGKGDEVNRLLSRLTDSQSLASALSTAYLHDVGRRAAAAQNYRVMLFVVAVILLLYALSAFINLREKTIELQAALADLRNQKFALDQHAIVSSADTRGNIIYANDRFCEISGYRREELLGQNHRLVNSGEHPPALFADLWRTITAGQVWHGQLKNRSRDGGHYWVDATIVPFVDDRGKPYQFISIRTDVTAHKALEQDLLIAKEAAEAANLAKSQFLATMSHEIRTPMNGIIGMTDLALDTELDDEQREYLGIVKHSAEHLLVILNDILDFSKIEAGHMALEQIAFNPRAMFEDGLKPLAMSATAKGLRFDWRIAEDHLPKTLQGDPNRLRQVLINLVNNAIKFTAQGGIDIDIQAVIDTAANRAELRFSISDSGIGMSAEQQAQLFSPFTQVDASITRKYGGTGLGLAISKQLVELMHGRIWVESQPGTGSRFQFIVHLPLVAEPVPGPAMPELNPVPIVTVERALRILVADDNPINRQLAVRLLEKAGHSVVLAEDGHQAIDRWREGGIDLILMDMMMPRLDGLATTRALRELEQAHAQKRVAIVAMTANAYEDDRERCLAAGMNGFVSKPIQAGALFAEIGRALG